MNHLDRATRAFICGVSGIRLTDEERHFLSAYRPWGVILFSRNISNKAQLSDLTDEIRSEVGDSLLPILIDQEGGRVARLTEPLVRTHPAAATYGQIFAQDEAAGLGAAFLGGKIMAAELVQYGISVDCAPCLDVRRPETADIIGNRAFSFDPEAVAQLGGAFASGLMEGGVLPVMKHIPGHGRGAVDSHLELPVIESSFDELVASDFVPFKKLSDLPVGMTGHLLFRALDADRVSTCSPFVIQEIIRKAIGFEGLLMGDDVSMEALSGSISERARASLEAGCDLVLHCNGRMDEMRAVAEVAPVLTGASLERAEMVQNLLEPLRDAWGKQPSLEDIEHWGELLSSVSLRS